MKRLTTSSYKVYATITSSIAFWPAIITSGFLALALGMLHFETTALSTFLEKQLPFMLASEEENARLILNIVAAGTISLTVFSFSMVMIVLSQASSNLSPRVIPQLATVRGHQLVLGFYIGTIVYSLLLLLNFKKDAEGTGSTPAIAVILSLIFGIVSILLFVYFIHSISRNIHVDNILNNIFIKAYHALELEKDVSARYKKASSGNEEKEQIQVRSTRNGYLKLIELEKLLQLATRRNMEIKILADVGGFIIEGTSILTLNGEKEITKELAEELENCFLLSLDEVVMEDFEQGVKQISEIAVKALSPGINDPGTAIKAIDFLTLLFLKRIKTDTYNCLYDKEEKLRVTENIVSVDELLYRYISPIRTYGRGDIQINVRLLRCMQGLITAHANTDQFLVKLTLHVKAIIYDADEHISNNIDRKSLNKKIDELNIHLPEELKIRTLQI